ncbi:MAG: hypothetical protein IJS97_08445 [Prevotella sp.]|nr:hypothetical protein [Prevotella sp.]
MEQIIKLHDIYKADLYTRSRASELRLHINHHAKQITLDFIHIGFMSRSFADELISIMDEMNTVTFRFINRNEDVEMMMTKVAESRKHERLRGIGNAKMYEFHDMNSLSRFLLTM